MRGFSQIIRARALITASAPGNQDADGYHRLVAGLRRQALLTTRRSGHLRPSAMG